MQEHFRIHDIGGRNHLSLDCGELPADDAITAAGHEPNGYFWEGVAALIAPEVTARVELDSEGGMFSASGTRPDLEQLQAALEPLVVSTSAISGVIERANAEGFEFDD